MVFNGRVGALTGKNAMLAKVGETVLIVHSQANRDTRPHLIGGHGDYVWETGKFSNPAGDRSRDLVHPRRLRGRGALQVPPARHLRLRQPQSDRGRRARRDGPFQGRGRVERRPDDTGQGARTHRAEVKARPVMRTSRPSRLPTGRPRSEIVMLLAWKIMLAAAVVALLAISPCSFGQGPERSASRVQIPELVELRPVHSVIARPANSRATASP